MLFASDLSCRTCFASHGALFRRVAMIQPHIIGTYNEILSFSGYGNGPSNKHPCIHELFLTATLLLSTALDAIWIEGHDTLGVEQVPLANQENEMEPSSAIGS